MRIQTFLVCLAAACSAPDPLELDSDEDGPIAPEDVDGGDEESGVDGDGMEPEPDPDPEIQGAETAGCSFIPKVIVYAPGYNTLPPVIAAGMEAAPALCTQYYFMLPAMQDPSTCIGGEDCLKLRPRPTAADLRAKSSRGNFHALAEFHWHHWAAWIARSPGTRTWTLAGEQFRREMADAGFDVAAGDSWSINELHSGLRRNLPGARASVVEAVAALHRGDPAYISPTTGLRAGARRGVVFAIGQSQEVENLELLEQNLANWLRDGAFWNAMKAHVQYFAQETYPSPSAVCVGGATLAARTKAVNAFTMHFARLAQAAVGTPAQAATAAARTYFDRAYVPLLGGVWPDDLYGNTSNLTATQMMKFASLQIYATRLWAAQHPYPDARIGVAWRVDASPQDNQAVTQRVANALMHAYSDQGSRAIRACSNDGSTDSWCRCSVTGAQINPAWAKPFTVW